MPTHFTLNQELPQEYAAHENPDIKRILQFLSTTELNLTRIQKDIDHIHTNIQQIRLLVLAMTITAEDVFLDADTFDD